MREKNSLDRKRLSGCQWMEGRGGNRSSYHSYVTDRSPPQLLYVCAERKKNLIKNEKRDMGGE